MLGVAAERFQPGRGQVEQHDLRLASEAQFCVYDEQSVDLNKTVLASKRSPLLHLLIFVLSYLRRSQLHKYPELSGFHTPGMSCMLPHSRSIWMLSFVGFFCSTVTPGAVLAASVEVPLGFASVTLR